MAVIARGVEGVRGGIDEVCLRVSVKHRREGTKDDRSRRGTMPKTSSFSRSADEDD